VRRMVAGSLGLLLVLFAAPAGAQRPSFGAAVDSAMAPLAWLIGEWEGTGTTQSRTGSQPAAVREKVEGRLGGRVLVIEGIGREPSAGGDGRVVHHAFGVLSYDAERKQYVFRAFSEGGMVDAETRLAGGVFTWEMAIPEGRIRYHIQRDGEEWLETGEYSLDGTTWRKFFEMRLRRVADAATK
jgi:hypothetical protein